MHSSKKLSGCRSAPGIRAHGDTQHEAPAAPASRHAVKLQIPSLESIRELPRSGSRPGMDEDETDSNPSEGMLNTGFQASTLGARNPFGNQQTLEQCLAFHALLRQRRGSLLRAWRLDFDAQGHGRVSNADFVKTCRNLGFAGETRHVWRGLKGEMSSAPLRFQEFAPDEFSNLEEFVDTLWAKVGFDFDAAWALIDVGRRLVVNLKEFESAAQRLGFVGNAQLIFQGLDTGGLGRLTRQNFEFLLEVTMTSSWMRQTNIEIRKLTRWLEQVGGFNTMLTKAARFQGLLARPLKRFTVPDLVDRLAAAGFPGDARSAALAVFRNHGGCQTMSFENLRNAVEGTREVKASPPQTPPYPPPGAPTPPAPTPPPRPSREAGSVPKASLRDEPVAHASRAADSDKASLRDEPIAHASRAADSDKVASPPRRVTEPMAQTGVESLPSPRTASRATTLNAPDRGPWQASWSSQSSTNPVRPSAMKTYFSTPQREAAAKQQKGTPLCSSQPRLRKTHGGYSGRPRVQFSRELAVWDALGPPTVRVRPGELENPDPQGGGSSSSTAPPPGDGPVPRLCRSPTSSGEFRGGGGGGGTSHCLSCCAVCGGSAIGSCLGRCDGRAEGGTGGIGGCHTSLGAQQPNSVRSQCSDGSTGGVIVEGTGAVRAEISGASSASRSSVTTRSSHASRSSQGSPSVRRQNSAGSLSNAVSARISAEGKAGSAAQHGGTEADTGSGAPNNSSLPPGPLQGDQLALAGGMFRRRVTTAGIPMEPVPLTPLSETNPLSPRSAQPKSSAPLPEVPVMRGTGDFIRRHSAFVQSQLAPLVSHWANTGGGATAPPAKVKAPQPEPEDPKPAAEAAPSKSGGKAKGKGKPPPPPCAKAAAAEPASEETDPAPKAGKAKGPGKGPEPKGKGKGADADKGKGKGKDKGKGKGKAAEPKVEPRKPDVRPDVQVKKLYWSSFRLNDSEANTVWNEIDKEGLDIDTDELANLFKDEIANRAKKERKKQEEEEIEVMTNKVQVIDSGRRRQVCIMMAKLPGKNAVNDALRTMNSDSLSPEQVELLFVTQPPDEEVQLLRQAEQNTVIDETNVWDVAEDFLLMLIHVPEFKLRLDIWNYLNTFQESLSILNGALNILSQACECVLTCQSLRHLLGLILHVGNFLNGGTPRGRADGFAIDTLVQMRTVKMSQGDKGTLVDYVVQQMERKFGPELNEMLQPGGAAEQLLSASRYRLEDVSDELVCLNTSAKRMLRMTRLEKHAEDPVLNQISEGLAMCMSDVEVQLHTIHNLNKRYEELCAWFQMTGTSKKKTDEFFGVWSKFMEDVNQAFNKLLTKRKRAMSAEMKRPGRRRSVRSKSDACGRRRSSLVGRLPSDGGEDLAALQMKAQDTSRLSNMSNMSRPMKRTSSQPPERDSGRKITFAMEAEIEHIPSRDEDVPKHQNEASPPAECLSNQCSDVGNELSTPFNAVVKVLSLSDQQQLACSLDHQVVPAASVDGHHVETTDGEGLLSVSNPATIEPPNSNKHEPVPGEGDELQPELGAATVEPAKSDEHRAVQPRGSDAFPPRGSDAFPPRLSEIHSVWDSPDDESPISGMHGVPVHDKHESLLDKIDEDEPVPVEDDELQPESRASTVEPINNNEHEAVPPEGDGVDSVCSAPADEAPKTDEHEGVNPEQEQRPKSGALNVEPTDCNLHADIQEKGDEPQVVLDAPVIGPNKSDKQESVLPNNGELQSMPGSSADAATSCDEQEAGHATIPQEGSPPEGDELQSAPGAPAAELPSSDEHKAVELEPSHKTFEQQLVSGAQDVESTGCNVHHGMPQEVGEPQSISSAPVDMPDNGDRHESAVQQSSEIQCTPGSPADEATSSDRQEAVPQQIDEQQPVSGPAAAGPTSLDTCEALSGSDAVEPANGGKQLDFGEWDCEVY